MFSATLDREVAALVDEFLVDPAVYEVAGETQETSTIDHRILVIDHRDKAEILTSLVDRDGKTLVFARTRAYAAIIAEEFGRAVVVEPFFRSAFLVANLVFEAAEPALADNILAIGRASCRERVFRYV